MEIARRETRLAKIAAAKARLEAEVDKKALQSFAYHDALPLGSKGGFIYDYNAQATVDEARQIVVAAELHESAADTKALPAVLDKVEESFGKTPLVSRRQRYVMSGLKLITQGKYCFKIVKRKPSHLRFAFVEIRCEK